MSIDVFDVAAQSGLGRSEFSAQVTDVVFNCPQPTRHSVEPGECPVGCAKQAKWSEEAENEVCEVKRLTPMGNTREGMLDLRGIDWTVSRKDPDTVEVLDGAILCPECGEKLVQCEYGAANGER